MTEKLDELYRDIIMDHYRFPRGHKELPQADIKNEGENPVCGDHIEVAVRIKNEIIEDIAVSCMGCAISVASGSMLADIVKGKSLLEVKKIASTIKAILQGENAPNDLDIGDLEALAGVKHFPVRVKCALLSWTTLVDAIEALEEEKTLGISSTE